MSKEIIEASIQTQGKGELASGNIVIETEDITYFIEYDTVTTPDGLNMTVTDTEHDEVRTQDNGYTEPPEYILDAARETLSHYHHEAKKGKGSSRQGRVVFSGNVGFSDGWTP